MSDVKQQVWAFLKKQPFKNAAYPIVSEYSDRIRLRKLGFTSDLSNVPYWKAKTFCYISGLIDEYYDQKKK